MRTILHVIVLLAVAAAMIAASPSAHHTVVGAEDCVAGIDTEEAATPDWIDLCSLSFGTGGSADLEVRLTTVGSTPDRAAPATYRVSWQSSSCHVAVQWSDHLAGGAFSDLSASCGAPDVTCGPFPGPAVPVNCVDEGTVHIEDEIDPPVFDGTTVTWSLDWEGDLALLGWVHESGDVIESSAGVGANSTSGTYGFINYRGGPVHHEACTPTGCTAPLDDRLDADRAYVID